MDPAQIIAATLSAGRHLVAEGEAKAILQSHGVDVPRGRTIGHGVEVRAAIEDLTPPFALKIVSSDISHKSDVGGVRLNLHDAEEIIAAMAEMKALPALQGAAIDGFLVEEMVAKGHEMVVGGTVDDKFGPVLMVGLGGVFVEILKDVSFRLCPIDDADARDMLGELKGLAILQGARGGPASSLEKVIDVMMRIGGPKGLLTAPSSGIAEIDINPLIVTDRRAVAADARIVLKQS